MPNWQQAERDVCDALGLTLTTASGRLFHDVGDSTNYAHYRDDSYAVIVDSKSTEHKGYRLTRGLLMQWQKKSIQLGKRFLLHLQFQFEDGRRSDWIISEMRDYAELYNMARDRQIPEVVVRYRSDEDKKSLMMLSRMVRQIVDPGLRLQFLGYIEQLETSLPKSPL